MTSKLSVARALSHESGPLYLDDNLGDECANTVTYAGPNIDFALGDHSRSGYQDFGASVIL